MQGAANAACLEGFLFPALSGVAPYCVPGGVKVVSSVGRASRLSCKLDPQRIGEDNPEEEQIFRNLWADETQRTWCSIASRLTAEVRVGRPTGL